MLSDAETLYRSVHGGAITIFTIITFMCKIQMTCVGSLVVVDNAGSLSGRVERQYEDMDYDSFIGLMGRRSTGVNAVPPLRRDMDDIFVGLLGRRSSDSGIPPLRGERRGSLIMKNGKLRFRRAV
ncbi:hypothetical protein NFI96_021909 [Prochilodus magdalenae]|nr:hypothetical protein NFI96_021909 [Prochilodus magdalenae]